MPHSFPLPAASVLLVVALGIFLANNQKNQPSYLCNIQKISLEQFKDGRYGSLPLTSTSVRTPVIVQLDPSINALLASKVTQHAFAQQAKQFGDEINVCSGCVVDKSLKSGKNRGLSKSVPVDEFVRMATEDEWTRDTKPSDRWYMFSPIGMDSIINHLMKDYVNPFAKKEDLPSMPSMPSMGSLNAGAKGAKKEDLPSMPSIGSLIAGAKGSGVMFHHHVTAMCEILTGAKFVVLFENRNDTGERIPGLGVEGGMAEWVEDFLPGLIEKGGGDEPHYCSVEANEVIVFPKDYYHATLNLKGFTVSVSHFI
ncbi:hypothetical protein ScalyP_jg4666 [Parmales sp. scaly parma]|nr:hypothetical protein ScalyP_jg4666 [Parmales sp. scaly parma]